MSKRNSKSRPYPISNEVYWVRGTHRRPFHIDIEGDKITLQPPPEFEEVFQRFVEDEDEEDEAGSEGA